MSFYEVNEHLDKSLAIEVPDDVEEEFMSASTLDLHRNVVTSRSSRTTPSSAESDPELLNILCELAEEHSSSQEVTSDRHSKMSSASKLTVTTPVLETTSSCDTVEDLPYDEDSILGTQSTKLTSDTGGRELMNSSFSDDEERETLEMTQVFVDNLDGAESA